MTAFEQAMRGLLIGATLATEVFLVYALCRLLAFLDDWAKNKAFLIDEWRRNK